MSAPDSPPTMSLCRPPIYLSFLFPPLINPSYAKRCLHASSRVRTDANANTGTDHSPQIDPDLRALLYDVDLSLARPTAKARRLRREMAGYQARTEHRELEVIQDLPDLESLEVEDEEHVLFPLNERKSPAASFGSRQIGAVVLPWELQKSVTRLLNESEKHLVHTDAKRLFRHSSTADPAADRDGFTPRSWDTHYVPPPYTEVNSTSKMAHIKARVHKHRDGTAFASVVMPAQYAVIRAVLEHVKTRLGPRWANNVERVVDWGSGTGAGVWAAMNAFRKPAAHTGDMEADVESAERTPPNQEAVTEKSYTAPKTSLEQIVEEPLVEEEGEETFSLETISFYPDSPVSETTLSSTQISSYIAIEKRDGLSSIARRLLRDIPLPSGTQISQHKYLHDSERVPRSSEVGLGTIAMSAFLLNTFTGPAAMKRKEVLDEMWESGADVLIVIEDATVAGFQNVVDARDYLINRGKKELKRLRAAEFAGMQGKSEHEGKTLAEMGIDDLHPDLADLVVVESNFGDVGGKMGAHVVAPCPHDKPCPLAFHQRLTSGGKRSTDLQISAKTVRCTFVQKLQRPQFVRLTKHVKKGEEDVGYSYVVIRRGEKERRGVVSASRDGRVGAVGRWEEEKQKERKNAEIRGEMWRESTENAVIESDADVEVRERRGESDVAVDVDLGALDQEDVPSVMAVENVDVLKNELEDLLREESYDWPRVTFPPLKRSGHVIVDACMPEGSIMRMTFTRSQSKQIYHDARKSKWGDIFPHISKNKPVIRYTAPNTRGPKQPSSGLMQTHSDPEEQKEEKKAQKQLDELFGVEEEDVSKKKDKAAKALQSKKLLRAGRGGGGEGALSKDEKVSTRAGWDEIVGELKKGDKKRRKARKEARLLKESSFELEE